MEHTQSQLAGWMTWTDTDGTAMAGPESVYRLYLKNVTDTMELSHLYKIQDAMEKLGDKIPYLTSIEFDVIQETILQKRQELYNETLDKLLSHI